MQIRLLALLSLSSALSAQSRRVDSLPQRVDTTPSRAAASSAPLVYAKRGLPARRIGAGTRAYGDAAALAAITLLAPLDHVAQTTVARPTLSWVYDPWVLPWAGTTMWLVVQDGAQRDSLRIDRSAAGVVRAQVPRRLTAGRTYEWTVRITSTADPSRAVDASAALRLVAGPPVTTGTAEARARSSAARGLWYDAFEALWNSPDIETQRALLTFVRETIGIEALPRPGTPNG
jgi:hypothetical protein